MNTMPPIVFAVIAGDIDLVRRRILAGMDVNYEDPQKSTALCQAVHRGHYDIVTLLLASGVDPKQIDGRGKVALKYCQDEKIAKLLGAQSANDYATEIDYDATVMAIACDGIDGFMTNGGWRAIPAFISALRNGCKEDDAEKVNGLWEAILSTYDNELDDDKIHDFFSRYYKPKGIRLSFE